MASYNRVVLVGNLARDPNFKSLQSGTSVTEVTLAVSERKKDPNGSWTEDVNFFDVNIFGRSAEVARDYTHKGSPLLVEGRLKQDSWEQDGQKRYKVRVIAERIVLLGSRNSDSEGGSFQQQGGYQQNGYGYQQGNNQGGYGYQQSGYPQSGYQQPNSYQQPAPQQAQPAPAPMAVHNPQNNAPMPGNPMPEASGDDIPF